MKARQSHVCIAVITYLSVFIFCFAYTQQISHISASVRTFTAPVYKLPLLAGSYRITQEFSWYHPGYDMATEYGSFVYPVASGHVAEVGYESYGYGRFIIIEHEYGIRSLYAHLSIADVSVGEFVPVTKPIGRVGSTGRSSGPHLHLEIFSGDEKADPKAFLFDLYEPVAYAFKER